MNALGDGPDSGFCVNHPRRETALRCGKCGSLICTKCMVVTPVGVRCRSCAQLRRLPQFDVGGPLLLRAGLAGLAISAIGWFVLWYAVGLRYFLSILVGLAVGEAMSRLARRRTSTVLEAVAVADIVAGLLVSEFVHLHVPVATFLSTFNSDQGLVVSLLIPAIIASFVSVVKLR